MKILVVPKVIYRFRNQLEYSFEKKIIVFFKKVFPKANIEVAISKNYKKKPNLIILSGGNNITLFSKKKEDILRNKIDNFFFKYSLNKKIPIFGICHRAQFIARKIGYKFRKNKHHVKNHYIYIIDNKSIVRKQFVNSFHNITITKNSNSAKVFAIAEDDSLEAFFHKKLTIGGVIWHPERFKKFRNEDIKIIKNFYAAGNFSFGNRKQT